jgi:hypothetical protein
MRRWCALLVVGLFVFLAGAAVSPATEGRRALSPYSIAMAEGGPLPLAPLIKGAEAGPHPIHVQATGTLTFAPINELMFGPFHDWQVQAGGPVYGLDFGSDTKRQQLAARLKGKTVEITGTLKTVWHHPPYILEGPRPSAVLVTVIQVTSLKAVANNKAKASVVMEVRGTLEMDLIAILRSGSTASKPILRAAGKDYRLNFSANNDLAAIASKCIGHKVLLRGYYETHSMQSHVVGTSEPPVIGFVHDDVFVVTEIVFTTSK